MRKFDRPWRTRSIAATIPDDPSQATMAQRYLTDGGDVCCAYCGHDFEHPTVGALRRHVTECPAS